MNDTVKTGIGVGLLLHLLQIPMLFLFFSAGRVDWWGVGILMCLTQFLYMIPAVIIALIKRRARVAQGILIVFGLTFLLSAGICGAMLTHMSGGNHR